MIVRQQVEPDGKFELVLKLNASKIEVDARIEAREARINN